MDSPNSISMLLKTVLEIKDTVSTLNERSKNYYNMLNSQKKDIDNNSERIEKLEVDFAELKIFKEHSEKIDKLELDLNSLKRDKWWLGFISSSIGGIIMFIASKLF